MTGKKTFRLSYLPDVSTELNERRNSLLRIIKALEKETPVQASPGIRVKKHGAGFQYYKKENGTDVYIHASEKDMLRQILQAEYHHKVLDSAEKEIRLMEKYLAFLSAESAENIYPATAQGKQRCISPVIPTDEEYLAEWNAMKFIPKRFEPGTREQRSMKGEYMASKSEELIANALFIRGIPYHYEKPLSLDQNLTVYPDFTILEMKTRKIIYWEHLGLMDKEDYAKKAVRKIRSYAAAGIWPGDKLILTFETSALPLNSVCILNTINKYLQK